LRVKPGAKHPVWKTQSIGDEISGFYKNEADSRPYNF
jgi:hypothetical protein